MATRIYAFSCSMCGKVFITDDQTDRARMISDHSMLHTCATLTLAIGVD